MGRRVITIGCIRSQSKMKKHPVDASCISAHRRNKQKTNHEEVYQQHQPQSTNSQYNTSYDNTPSS